MLNKKKIKNKYFFWVLYKYKNDKTRQNYCRGKLKNLSTGPS